jgi:hypothetical protein
LHNVSPRTSNGGEWRAFVRLFAPACPIDSSPLIEKEFNQTGIAAL